MKAVKLLFLLVCGLLVAVWIVGKGSERNKAAEEHALLVERLTVDPAVRESEARQEQARREKCATDAVSQLREMASTGRKPPGWAAVNEAEDCAQLTQNSELASLANKQALRLLDAESKDPAKSLTEKRWALEAMRRRDEPNAASYDKRLSSMDQQEQRHAAQEKKLRGVSIGMTPDDVLASSWGKPNRINRTTTAAGVSEQWVYGGNNYLYFENGRVTSIQN